MNHICALILANTLVELMCVYILYIEKRNLMITTKCILFWCNI